MVTNYVLEVPKLQNNLLKFQKKRDIPDDDFDFPKRTPLRTDTADQPSPRPTSPTSTVPLRRSKSRKTTTRTVQSIHFILKGEECEIFMYSVTLLLLFIL